MNHYDDIYTPDSTIRSWILSAESALKAGDPALNNNLEERIKNLKNIMERRARAGIVILAVPDTYFTQA